MRAFAEATIDYQRLLCTVAERMARLVGHGCVIVLVSKDGQQLCPVAVYFEDPNLMRGVLYLSGYTEEAIAQHGLLDSSIVLLQKPVTPDVLLERVRELLESPPSNRP